MANYVLLLPAAATTLFLILMLSISPNPITADTENTEWVLDMDGKPVEAGIEYYIQPLGWGFRGGIGRSSFDCPLYAVESPSEADRGHPVKFIPDDESQKEIRFSSDLKIDSGYSDECNDDGFWRVFNISLRRVVVASGYSDAPRSWFRIEKADNNGAYKITHRPSNSFQRWDLGVYSDVLYQLKVLGLTRGSPEALHVGFIRETTTTVPYKATI